MAQKDPAVLIYFDKWISATNGIKAEFRAWYMDLLIYQYDKGGLPNDEDTLAGICRVLPSEYAKFTQMRTQIIAQKFTQCEDGMLRNDIMSDVLRKREAFKEKRSRSGYIGNIVKELNKAKTFTTIELSTIKDKLRVCIDEEFEEILSIYRLKDLAHLRTHLRTLYIDVNEDENINKDLDKIKDEKSLGKKEKPKIFKIPELSEIEEYFIFKESSKLEAEKFFNFYDSKNWEIGKNKMSKWKAAASGWILRNKSEKSGPLKINPAHDLDMKIAGSDVMDRTRAAAIEMKRKLELEKQQQAS